MKQLHKAHLWSWSLFDEGRDMDFNSVFWGRPGGNVVIDPLPLSEHDAAQIARLGGVQEIIVTNSDHARGTAQLLARAPARVWGPRLEPGFLDSLGARPLGVEHALGPDLEVIELHGSKTPGELCLLLEGDTLVTGDLIRGPRAGRLSSLPDAKLSDRALARESIEALARRQGIAAVLVGDGWPIFRGGSAVLGELLQGLQ